MTGRAGSRPPRRVAVTSPQTRVALGGRRGPPARAPRLTPAELARAEARSAGPWLELYDGQRTWTPQADLLGSGRLATHLVVEPEPGGVSRLRFGDGVSGRAPVSGTTALASHAVKAGLRAAINVSPDPVSTATASLTEDVLVGAVVALVVTHPWAALALSLTLLAIGLTLLALLWRAIRARSGGSSGRSSRSA